MGGKHSSDFSIDSHELQESFTDIANTAYSSTAEISTFFSDTNLEFDVTVRGSSLVCGRISFNQNDIKLMSFRKTTTVQTKQQISANINITFIQKTREAINKSTGPLASVADALAEVFGADDSTTEEMNIQMEQIFQTTISNTATSIVTLNTSEHYHTNQVFKLTIEGSSIFAVGDCNNSQSYMLHSIDQTVMNHFINQS